MTNQTKTAILTILLLLMLVACVPPPPNRPTPPPSAAEVQQQPAPASDNSRPEPAPTQGNSAVTDISVEATDAGQNIVDQAVAPVAIESSSQPPAQDECPASHFLEVQADPANAAYPAPSLSVTCGDTTFTVRSNGIPNFEFTPVTPSDLAAQNYSWEIPLKPQAAAEPADIPLLGPVAIAVNGLPIYGPNEAQPTWGDPYLDQILDFCNGHTAQRGDYHFHTRPDCLFENLEGNPALVIAYALDGYPILAPYICENAACTSVKEVQSSWQHTQNIEAAWEAHEYVAGSGDLDRCNGTTRPDGSYVYFATDTFPYFLGCYHGLVNSNLSGAGSNGPVNVPPGGGRPDLATAGHFLRSDNP